MPSLRDIQLRFIAALHEGVDAIVDGELVRGAPSAAARLSIYRNNLREGFILALASSFPVVERLVGNDFFRNTVREFQLEHPSRSGDLANTGAPFPEFLRARFASGDFAWLPDVADLEWAIECVSTTPRDAAEVSESLAGVPAHRFEDLCFEPSSATRLVESRFPIARIWQTNQPGAPAESVDLDSGADHLLVRWRDGGLEFVRLSRADFVFARMLARGTPLGLATDASLAIDRGFDLVRTLRDLFQAGAFVRATLAD